MSDACWSEMQPSLYYRGHQVQIRQNHFQHHKSSTLKAKRSKKSKLLQDFKWYQPETWYVHTLTRSPARWTLSLQWASWISAIVFPLRGDGHAMPNFAILSYIWLTDSFCCISVLGEYLRATCDNLVSAMLKYLATEIIIFISDCAELWNEMVTSLSHITTQAFWVTTCRNWGVHLYVNHNQHGWTVECSKSDLKLTIGQKWGALYITRLSL